AASVASSTFGSEDPNATTTSPIGRTPLSPSSCAASPAAASCPDSFVSLELRLRWSRAVALVVLSVCWGWRLSQRKAFLPLVPPFARSRDTLSKPSGPGSSSYVTRT
ncbi:unnamed protein product, partial [Ectocarpus sp. 12 AP-2014]